MKNFKKFTAAIAATLMAASLSIPMATSFTASAADVTITQVGEGTHVYKAYTIFTGTVTKDSESGSLTLESPTWANPDKSAELLAALKADTTIGSVFTDCTTDAASVAKAMGTINSNTSQAAALAKVIANNKDLVGTAVTSTDNVLSLDNGYYVIIDELTENSSVVDTAVSAYILQVVGDDPITLTAKAEKPSVDKQVYDNDDSAAEGDNNGWGESADHAINESFQFKLTATIPADADFAAYEKYKVVFNDEMSNGVTFESIESVKVAGNDADIKENSDVKSTAITGQAGGAWTLTIDDILKYDHDLTDGATIEVIYNAHLNPNAIISTESGEAVNTNNNKVNLSYSNNPNATGENETLGKTTEDYVWVFTYDVENTKYKNSVADGNELADAGFKLYDSTGTTEIKLIYDEDKSAYRPIGEGEEGVEMKSAANGVFNIIGLDAGKYTLKETTTPDGYNTCDPITITISATHKENANETSADLTLTETNGKNDIINKSGSTLPSTGGIGTKLFYLGGGCMVAVAGIFLITKKRMSKNAE
ncbi:MAG: isopeptide-forming domain-containing fimbrial protein [Ruminococcus flavefaciens]|nr:isopeptide-forming domain-containing fimbrial protein [Ruminococcus flavefaciens]MCM1059958.1 isopeptide-forming domain-containing fimbrial protein [Eubacterium sp.]